MLIIAIAAFFVIIGSLVKYGKMYFLIAGYNTMSAEEKAEYDIEGIASIFRNGFFAMAILMVAITQIPLGISDDYIGLTSIMVSVLTGVTYILVKANSKKYKMTNNDKEALK